jgi:phospholipase/lecithinase/hemolysin
LVLWAIWPASLHAGPYSQMVVFGDSLSDTGNVDDLSFGLVPGSDYWEGRFSNGPLWEEHVADAIGLPRPTASRDGGFNYAFGGAETGGGSVVIIPFVLELPNLGTQIDDYLDDHQPNANILYTVWGGGNDFLEGDTTNPAVPAANLADHIRTLAAAGARNFIVPNLPLMGQLPRHRGTASQETMDNRSRQFSGLLATQLDTIQRDLGVTIFRPDVQSFFEQVIADPAIAGLTNVTQPALDSGTNNPDGYLFWDDIHPSRAGHQLLGEEVASMLVPFETHGFVSADSTTSWTDSQGMSL